MNLHLQFSVKTQMSEKVQYHVQPSIASNGKHMYILLGKSLYKIGTGFNGTLKGYVYAVNADFCKDKSGWIGFCGVWIAIDMQFYHFSYLLNLSIFFSELIALQENLQTEQRNYVGC